MDKYVYPNTNILKNKLNIKNQKELTLQETRLTNFKVFELRLNENKKIKRTFDFKHLKSIHKYLFEEIYEWAGKVKDVDIAKGNTLFCKSVNIENFSNDIFSKLKRENYFIGLDKKELSDKLAVLFLDINAMHPFREGNGRTQREFIRELAEDRGFRLEFENFSKEDMIFFSVKDDSKELGNKFYEFMKELDFEKNNPWEKTSDKENSKNPWETKVNSDKDNQWER